MQLAEVLMIVNLVLSVLVPPLSTFILRIRRSECCGSSLERDLEVGEQPLRIEKTVEEKEPPKETKDE